MVRKVAAFALVLAWAWSPAAGGPGPAAHRPAGKASTAPTPAPATVPAGKVFVVVFDFAGGPDGLRLADKIRLRLRKHRQYDVLDRLTTQEFSGPLAVDVRPDKVRRLTKALACQIALHGTVGAGGDAARVDARCLDLRRPDSPQAWVKAFRNATERRLPVIALEIVEALRGEPEWVPPQYGDETEPTNFAKPVNRNGDFERGHVGWDPPDNVSTFLTRGPAGRGRILRVRTDLQRDPWLAYRRALRLGTAHPSRPPAIGRDTSYSSVAGLEGVHYRSEWLAAKPLRRYWMLADHNGQGGAKVFVKGFRDWSAQADGLPESSLATLGLTPRQFANLPAKRQKALIAADAKKHPGRHRRECYRWYLNCAEAKNEWKHLAAPFPPRGGLPPNVQWLQIQVYSYWSPGEYLWDNVFLHTDPRQDSPAPVEKARTPNFDKR